MTDWFEIVVHEDENFIEYVDRLIINPHNKEYIDAVEPENLIFEDELEAVIKDISPYVAGTSVGKVVLFYEIDEVESRRLGLVADGAKLTVIP